MKQNLLKGITLAAVAILGATAVWAAVPPPPVNQSLYIKDTSFDKFTTADCHTCHGTDPELVVKHHALINNNPTGVALSCVNSSGTMPATFATGCHVMIPNVAPLTGFRISDPTACFDCHGTNSPHHTTTYAAAQDCQHCHGDAVDSPSDGHVIPTSPMDTGNGGVTPGPVGRTVANGVIVQGCAACHQANAALNISDNKSLHHGTGIGQGTPGTVGSCVWCHANSTVTANNFTIRACEACHGIPSLHSIQAETTSTTSVGSIKPGLEAAGFGHVGANWDCQGCHWSWTGTAVTDTTLATVPAISSLTTPKVIAGRAANLTILGNSFINDNTSGTTTYTPKVVLTSGNDTITLTPFSQTVSEVKVALPTSLKTGVYEVRIDKNGTTSNLAKLVVAPQIQVASAMLSGTTLTIAGTGFGTAPATDFRNILGVYVDGKLAKTVSWSNSKIVASSPLFAAAKSVTVKTLFGPVSGTIAGATKKVR